MPAVLKGINLLLIRDRVIRRALQEIAAFLETASDGNFGDFETKRDGGGLVTLDAQKPGRKWRIRVSSSGETKGGAELQIDSTGALTAARDSDATGTVIIRIDDAGN